MEQKVYTNLPKEGDKELSITNSKIFRVSLPFTSPYLLSETERELRLLGACGIGLCATDLDDTLLNPKLPIYRVRETLETACGEGMNVAVLTSRSGRGFLTVKEELEKGIYSPGKLFILTTDGLQEKSKDGWRDLYTLRILPHEAEQILKALNSKLGGFLHSDRAQKLVNDLPSLDESWPEETVNLMKNYPGVLYVGSKLTLWPKSEDMPLIEDIIDNGKGMFLGEYRVIKQGDSIDIVPCYGLDPKLYAIRFLKDHLDLTHLNQIVTFGNSPDGNDAGLLSLPNSYTILAPDRKLVCSPGASEIETVLAFHDAIYAVSSAAGEKSSNRYSIHPYRAFFDRLEIISSKKGARLLTINRDALLDLELEERGKVLEIETSEDGAKRSDLPTYNLFKLVGYGIDSIPKFFSLYSLLREKTFISRLKEEGAECLDDPSLRTSYEDEYKALALDDSINQTRLHSIVSNDQFIRAFELAFSYHPIRVSSSAYGGVFVGDTLVGHLSATPGKPNSVKFSETYEGICDKRSILEALALDIHELGWNLENVAIASIPLKLSVNADKEIEIFKYLDAKTPRSTSAIFTINDDYSLNDFDPVVRLFSALKYFDPRAIEEACRLLTDHLFVQYGREITENPKHFVLVTSNPFAKYDTVIGNVTSIVAERLNLPRAFVQNKNGITNTLVFRKPYATMNSASEREQRLIDEDQSYSLYPSSEMVEGKTVIFIDDIINTGMTIKHSIRRIMKEASPAKIAVIGLVDLVTNKPRKEFEMGEYLVSVRDLGHIVAVSEPIIEDSNLVLSRRFFGLLRGLGEVEFLAYMRGLPSNVRNNLENLWKEGEFPPGYLSFIQELSLTIN